MDISDIRMRKKELKLTTQQIAYLAELPVSTVSKIMTGETKNPSYITIERIEKVILQEEMARRIKAYRKAFTLYCEGLNKGEDVDRELFDRKYRRENHLDNAPIPFARVRRANNEIGEGNLAKVRDYRLTADSLEKIGEDKNIELIDGRLIINQAPDLQHQIVVQNIGKIIDRYIEDNHGKCKVFNVGVNVFLEENDYTLLIPDIVVVCDENKLQANGIYGVPDWIIEVVSNSSRKLDYNEKMHKYMVSGVSEYWIVDVDKQRITVYIKGEPMMAYVYGLNDEVPVGIYQGKLSICLYNIMRRV